MSKGKKSVKKQDLNKNKVSFGKYKDKTLIWVARNDLEFFKQIQNLYFEKYSKEKQNYYNTVFKQYVVGVVDLNIEIQVRTVISLLKQKWSTNSISKYLKEINLTQPQIHTVISNANLQIRKEFEEEKNFILDIHLLRYEQIYSDNIDVDLEHISPGYRKAIECEHKLTALETLFQKERLLGVHTKSFKLQLEKHSLVHKNKDLDFDLTKLSVQERLEVASLLNKAKPVERFNQPVIQNENPLDIDKHNNILEVEKEIAPISLAKQTNKKAEEESQEKQSEGKTLDEVKEVISKNLKDKITELFEKKKNYK